MATAYAAAAMDAASERDAAIAALHRLNAVTPPPVRRCCLRESWTGPGLAG